MITRNSNLDINTLNNNDYTRAVISDKLFKEKINLKLAKRNNLKAMVKKHTNEIERLNQAYNELA